MPNEVRLRIVFSKAAFQKRGSTEPMEPPLDPPVHMSPWCSLVPKKGCMVWEHLVLLLVLKWPHSEAIPGHLIFRFP